MQIRWIDDFVIGILISKEGVNFEAIDNKDTYVFVFIIAPADKQNEHVRLLSYISQYLRKDENISRLINTKDKENIRKSIIRHTSKSKEIKQTDMFKLITVIIQNENKFDDILNVITEFEGSNIAITDGFNAGKFLYHMPLFSSFMRTDINDFCRIITATVESKIVEDLTNNLTDIIDEKNKNGSMFFIQNIEYLHGILEI